MKLSGEKPGQHRTDDNLPQKEASDMVWSHVKEGRGGHYQEDVKHASAGKEKNVRHKKRLLDNMGYGMK